MLGHNAPLAPTAQPAERKNETLASASPSSPMASSGIAGTANSAAAVSTLTTWLEARGLCPELAAKMGWAPVSRNGETWVAIPYQVGAVAVTTQFRNLGAKEFRFPPGSAVELWNVNCLADDTLANEPLIICEGACDGLAMIQAGYPRTIAVPGWSESNTDPERYEPFKRHEKLIRKAKLIVVARHNDNAGAAMLRGIAAFFDGVDVRYATWPDGCNDANDAWQRCPDMVPAIIKAARKVDPPGGLITGFSDLPPRPLVQIWKVGFPKLDRLIAFRSREISVLTGIPGSGKTTFATWLAHHVVRTADIRIGMGLFETDPIEVLDHFAKLHVSVPRDELPAKLDRNFRLFHRTDDTTETHGMKWLQRMIHTLAARDGCKLIIIDPWNELEHLPEVGESLTAYTNFALMRLRQWAENLDIHIMIVSHPRKMEPGQKPVGYHISDSAAWANKPGMGWTIHMEENSGGEFVSLTTWKVRSRQGTGTAPGMCRLTFDPDCMVYREK